MHRKRLLDLLDKYRRHYPEEWPCIDRFRQFMTANTACFERSCVEGHITGSVWMVNRAGTHVLLTHHRKLNRWLQLGGYADGQVNILEVAMQEAREESGIVDIIPVSHAIFDLDIHRIPARGNESMHDHYDVRFAIKTVATNRYVVGRESHALRWVEIAHFPGIMHEPTMLRMCQKWQDGNA